MRLQLSIFLAMSAIVLSAHAQEASKIPQIIGKWRLSEACPGPRSLVISAPNTNQLAINGVLYPVTDISIGHIEPSVKYPDIKLFNFELPTADTLFLRMKEKESAHVLTIIRCNYTRQGAQISEPEVRV